MVKESNASSGARFEFIVSDPRSSSNRKRIRQHVHRDAQRQRKLRSAEALKLTEPLPWVQRLAAKSATRKPRDAFGEEQDSTSSSDTLVVRRQINRHPSQRKSIPIEEPFCSIGSGSHDPFDSSVAPISRVHSFYLTFFATSMWHGHPSKNSELMFFNNFGSFLVGNEALFYAVVAAAAARRASKVRNCQLRELRSGSEDQAFLLYTTKSMSAVRQGLSKSSEDAASDATIGAISFLAMAEAVDSGDKSRSVSHMNAVAALVKSRGYQTISWVWYERALSADLKTACIIGCRPWLPFPRNVLVDHLIRQCSKAAESSLVLNSASLLHTIEDLLTPKTFEILVELRELGNFQRFSSDQQTVFGYDTEWIFKHQRLAIEHRLLEDMEFQSHSTSTAIQRCVQFCLLLYINIAIWTKFETSCAILRIPAGHLKRELMAAELSWNRGWITEPSPRIVVWILFLGVCATKNQDTRPWFVEMLGRYLRRARIGTAEELKSLLSRILYMDSVFCDLLHGLYIECMSETMGSRTVSE